MRFIARPPVRSWKSSTNASTFSAVRLPGTTLTTSRCSGSRATWSQLSPCRASSEASGSQCFSFFPTKDHFSSNWTSRVFGGKSHPFVVYCAGVGACQPAVTGHRVSMDPDQATGLADAAAFVDVLQQRANLLFRQGRAEQRRSLALRKPPFAGRTAEHAPLFIRPIVIAHREVSTPALPVVGTLGILTTKPRQIIHDRSSMTQHPDCQSVITDVVCSTIARFDAIRMGHEAFLRRRSLSPCPLCLRV